MPIYKHERGGHESLNDVRVYFILAYLRTTVYITYYKILNVGTLIHILIILHCTYVHAVPEISTHDYKTRVYEADKHTRVETRAVCILHSSGV